MTSADISFLPIKLHFLPSWHVRQFPLPSRSGVLENVIGELSGEDEKRVLQLHDVPGGAKTFLLVAKLCYGVKIELTALNVVNLRCAAEYLEMTEDYGEGNLIAQTESSLDEIFGYWTDSIKAPETCEEVLPHVEERRFILFRDALILWQGKLVQIQVCLISWPMLGRCAMCEKWSCV